MSLRSTLFLQGIGIFPFCKIFSHGGNCNVKSSSGNNPPARRATLCIAVATIIGNTLSTFLNRDSSAKIENFLFQIPNTRSIILRVRICNYIASARVRESCKRVISS